MSLACDKWHFTLFTAMHKTDHCRIIKNCLAMKKNQVNILLMSQIHENWICKYLGSMP